jgi:predicted Ser/Thr protein kinase
LEPDVRIDREIGAGGMGTVFAGYDRQLDRPVAIKVLRPELASASLYERFLREARLLAKLKHPNVMPVYQAGTVDGLSYFIMEYVEGETLGERLERGPLPPDQVRSIGRDVLRALDAVHRLGIVHRDVKPANVFVLEDRALLGDFGIARVTSAPGDELTETGASPGTPAYMAPEQRIGAEATVASDLWAVGAMLYEAATGMRYDRSAAVSSSESLMPPDLARAVDRALAIDPALRWETAERFGRALEGKRARRWPAWAAPAIGVAVVAIAAIPFGIRRLRPTGQPTIVVAGFTGGSSPIAESVRRRIRAGLEGFPDFRVGDGPADGGRVMTVEPSVEVGPGRLQLGAMLRDGGHANSLGPWDGGDADWPRLADSVVDAVVIGLLTGQAGSGRWLPRDALPRSIEGLRGLLRGEKLYAAAQWEEAAVAYLAAERLDSTCALCSYRLDDVDRWLDRPHDPTRTARLEARIDRFPPPYQALIRAAATPLPARLDSLERAVARFGDFYLAWYRYGEELFHRGPLFGRRRGEAIEPFRAAVRLRPEFAPVWSHLTWIAVAEGDSQLAVAALGRLRRNERPEAPIDRAQRAMVEAGFAWRFTDRGAAVTAGLLADAGVAGVALLGAGPRLFPAFDSPDAAVWLGQQFVQRMAEPELVRSGLLGLALGRISLGRLDSALTTARTIRTTITDPPTQVFAIGLGPAVQLAAGDSLAAAGVDSLVAPLVPLLEAGARSLPDRHQVGLLVGLAGAVGGSDRWLGAGLAALADEPAPRSFRQLVEAGRLARAARLDSAIAVASVALADPTAALRSPFFRALATLARARWLALAGRPVAALIALRWHENSDLRIPTGEPLASEFDWAVSTIARWRAARLQDEPGRGSEACADYAAVHRRWTHGDAPFARLADSARSALTRLHCRENRPIP